MFLSYRRRRKATRRTTSARRSARPLRSERLEPRCLLSAVVMSDWEQLLVELVNRARANPQAEAARYDIALNAGLPAGTISPAPKQPLAPNQILTGAARDHSQDMLDRDFFAHTNPDGQSPFDRMKAAGYTYTTAADNLSWTGKTGRLDRGGAILDHHEGLFDSPGHRVNILGEAFREMGAGVRHGVFTSGNDYNASMVTEKFGTRSGDAFVTGVVYDDGIVDDDFYSLGEALKNVTITAVEASSGAEFVTQSGPSGGYALPLPPGTYTVTARGGPLEYSITTRDVVVGSENRKVDFDASLPPELVVWQNPVEPLDVSGNGKIEPLDALIVINYLNRVIVGPPPVMPDAPSPYLDVRGVGSVAPVDALLILNHLNRQNVAGGEGEFDAQEPEAEERWVFEGNGEGIDPAPEKMRPQPQVAAESIGSFRADALFRRKGEREPLLRRLELEATLADIAEDVSRGSLV